MARDLEAVVDAASAEPVVMCGNSQAAALAIAYAARHPERVNRMVLCGAFCRGLSKRPAANDARKRLMLELIELGWGTEQAAYKGLSARKREVLELIARGLGNDEFAGRLHISPRTVRNHITSVFSKLAVTSRAQAFPPVPI